jgi:hypothetical protein
MGKGMKYINPAIIERLETLDSSLTRAIEILLEDHNFLYDVMVSSGLKKVPDKMTQLKLVEIDGRMRGL